MGQTIRVLASAQEPGSKTMFGDRPAAVLVDLDADRLRSELERLTAVVRSVLKDLEHKADAFPLKQVSLGIEISAEGGVTLIGTLSAGAKAAITLVFER